mmetsp:Transcript_1536/g.3517  ORF Transcript_1536/g.3517 Transcript_1536/m.3517 type:complete len:527 (-) Transcript_1536:375-1955(-)
MMSSSANKFRVGDKVSLIKTGHHGMVAYEGKVKFRPGHWIGVVLNKPAGLNNGMVKGVRYFACKARYGIFVPASALKIIERARRDSKKEKKAASGFLKPRAKNSRATSTNERSRLKPQPKINRSSSSASILARNKVKSKRGRSASPRPRVDRLASTQPLKGVLHGAKGSAAKPVPASPPARYGHRKPSPRNPVKEPSSLKSGPRNSKAYQTKPTVSKPNSSHEPDMQNRVKALEAELAEAVKRAELTKELEHDLKVVQEKLEQTVKQLQKANQRIQEFEEGRESADSRLKELDQEAREKVSKLKRELDDVIRQKIESDLARVQLEEEIADINSGRKVAELNKADTLTNNKADTLTNNVDMENLNKISEHSEPTTGPDGAKNSNEKEITRLKCQIEAKDAKMKGLIEAAEDHALVLHGKMEEKDARIRSILSSNQRLKNQLEEADRKIKKLTHANRKLKLNKGRRESQRHGKMALEHFQKLDKKIKDMEFQMAYGNTKKVFVLILLLSYVCNLDSLMPISSRPLYPG